MRFSEAIGEAAFLPGRGFLTEQTIPQQLTGAASRLVLRSFDLGIECRVACAMQAQLRDQGHAVCHASPSSPASSAKKSPATCLRMQRLQAAEIEQAVLQRLFDGGERTDRSGKSASGRSGGAVRGGPTRCYAA